MDLVPQTSHLPDHDHDENYGDQDHDENEVRWSKSRLLQQTKYM